MALGTELETRFAPGSNVKGAVGGANWCFLLPSLDLGRVVCLGRPSPAGLTTLAGLADQVTVCAPADDLSRLRRSLGSAEPRNLSLLETAVETAPLPDGTADLVVLPRLPCCDGVPGPTGWRGHGVSSSWTGSRTSRAASSGGSMLQPSSG